MGREESCLLLDELESLSGEAHCWYGSANTRMSCLVCKRYPRDSIVLSRGPNLVARQIKVSGPWQLFCVDAMFLQQSLVLSQTISKSLNLDTLLSFARWLRGVEDTFRAVFRTRATRSLPVLTKSL